MRERQTQMQKILLGLRNNGHRVAVVTPNGATRPVLGTRDPQEQDRRAQAVKQWGAPRTAPRSQNLASIDQALPQRTQTIMSNRLSPELQQRLNGGIGTQSDSRKHGREEGEAEVMPD